MDPGSQNWAILISGLVLGLFIVFGAGLAFSSPSNIERPGLVGSATVVGALLGMLIFRLVWLEGGPYNWAQALVIMAMPALSFLVARFVDRMLGARQLDPERDESTYGSHLSD